MAQSYFSLVKVQTQNPNGTKASERAPIKIIISIFPPTSAWLVSSKVKASHGVDHQKEGDHQSLYKILFPSHLEGSQVTANHLGGAHPPRVKRKAKSLG